MEFEIEYVFNGLLYKISTTNDIHTKLEDCEYFQKYIEEHSNALEIAIPNSNVEKVPSVSFSWNSETTRLLITEYGSKIEEFRNPKMKKKLLWTDIKNIFIKKGYVISDDELDRKMRNLKHHYKTIKDNNNKKTKTGRGRIVWEFYTLLDEIFADDRTINFGETLASLSDDGPSVKRSLEEPSTSNAPPPKRENGEKKNNEKAAEARGLYKFRNECLKLESRRVTALEKLAEQAEDNNKIQRERNAILRDNKCSCNN